MRPLSTTVLASIDPVVRDCVSAGILLDDPGSIALSYRLETDGTLQRTVSDTTSIIDRTDVAITHTCLSCVLREDVVPTLLQLADLGRWRSVVLALPAGAELAPVVAALRDGVHGVLLGNRLRISSTVSAVDPATFEADLFGDDLLAERGLALGDGDRRSVGESVAHQVEYADVVVTASPATSRVARLLELLKARDALTWDDLDALDARRLFDLCHDPDRAARRTDPRWVSTATALGDDVWALDLHSSRPLHPERLMERLPDLGLGRFRCRGRFWLPTRPYTVCAWDGAGEQVSIGDVGGWMSTPPSTRLIAVGIDDSAPRLAATFDDVVLDEAELRDGLARYVGRPDGFDLWLGAASSIS